MACRKRHVIALIALYLVLVQILFVIHLTLKSHNSEEAKEAINSGREKAGVHQQELIENPLKILMQTPGFIDPVGEAARCIFKYERGCSQMRVQEQLDFIPKGIETNKKKTIMLSSGFGGWESNLNGPVSIFEKKQCRVQNCELVGDPKYMATADAVIFRNGYSSVGLKDHDKRPPHQTWIIYLLESPQNVYIDPNVLFNWTATYRVDSTLITPYAWWRPIENPKRDEKPNFAAGKTKFAAWFVSNCNTANRRLEFVRELKEFIPVDVYGGCGDKECSRGNADCWRMLNDDYKFYLSFENSNCRDYITEKFFETGLGHNVLPIVMGAPRSDYERVSPPNSFIHVEDFLTARELAEYLIKVNQTDELYNEYFEWKGKYTSDDTKFWCRVCAMLNEEKSKPRTVNNFQEWWNGPNVCIGEKRWHDVLGKNN